MSKWIDRIIIASAIVVILSVAALAQPPKVAVEVAGAAVQAAKQDQPTLPDDFGQASRNVAATWTPVESESTGPAVTLITAEGNWCGPCNVQRKILKEAGGIDNDGNPKWGFNILRVTQDNPLVEGGVPRWVVDGDDDGSETLTGAREAVSLKAWIEGQNRVAKNSPSQWIVEVDGSSSACIVSAVAEALRRQDDTAPAVQGFLPPIPVDVNDDLLTVLDAFVSRDGYVREGLRVTWPAGKRKMTFEPGVNVWVRKVVEVDATVTAIEIDGREVTLSLSGTLVNKLTVRLK